METLAVIVVSPDPLVRGGLAAMVAAQGALALAGEATPAGAAAAAARSPGAALLWDLGAAGADALRGAAGAVVALAADEREAGLALRAGARGVLLRGAAPGAIAAALAAAARGLAVLDGALSGDLLRLPAPAQGSPLTPREREVLALLAEGLANKAIAARLGISEHTAKFHVNAILGKLGVESRAEAIVQAVRMGLVAL